MDLRHLRSFAAVARTGSFTTAARELGFTQSAVSQHVAALEADVGRVLLTRRPVRLTPDGERLAAHARQILLRVDVARTELGPRHAPPHRFRLAVTPLALGPRVAAGLAQLRVDDGRATVELDVRLADDAVPLVADGSVDAALIDGVTTPNAPLEAAEPGTLTRRLVAEEPLVVLLPRDHPLAGVGTLALDAVRDALWVDAPRLRCGPDAVPGARTDPTPARLRYDGTDVAAVTLLVAAGHGLALLPADLAPQHPAVAHVALRDRLVHRVELLVVPGRAASSARLLSALTGT
jgi:DNA-binding transcriptional LysR family regulator